MCAVRLFDLRLESRPLRSSTHKAAPSTFWRERKNREPGTYVQKLHALDVLTGAEKFGGPVVIKASIPRKAMGVFNSTVAFDPLRENPRAALLFSQGKIYITWGSS